MGTNHHLTLNTFSNNIWNSWRVIIFKFIWYNYKEYTPQVPPLLLQWSEQFHLSQHIQKNIGNKKDKAKNSKLHNDIIKAMKMLSNIKSSEHQVYFLEMVIIL